MRGGATVQKYLWLSGFLATWMGLMISASNAQAQTQTLVIDSTRASASFWIRPVWLKRIEGVFPVLEGTAFRQLKDGSLVVDVGIDVRALQMQRGSYLTWAQSTEFFDVERHPWIRFRADAITPQRLREGGEITGWLELRETRGPIGFELEPASCDTPGIDCPVRASAAISRSAFGMDARRLALGDLVHLSISVYLTEASRAPLEP